MQIENPKKRIVEDLKNRNKNNMRGIAGEYFGSKFTYAQTFKMFEEYKKAFIAVDGLNEDKRRLIDSFINTIYLYDDKMVITFNYKDGSETISLSEIENSDLSSDLTASALPK